MARLVLWRAGRQKGIPERPLDSGLLTRRFRRIDANRSGDELRTQFSDGLKNNDNGISTD